MDTFFVPLPRWPSSPFSHLYRVDGWGGVISTLRKKITLAFGAGTLEWQDLRQGRWRGRKRLRPHGFCRDFAGGERELPNTVDNATRRHPQSSRERRVLPLGPALRQLRLHIQL